MDEYVHTPVLLAEAVGYLVTDPEGCYIDGTLGGGGHAAAVLSRLGAGGRLVGFDADPRAVAACRARFAGEARFTALHANVVTLRAWRARAGDPPLAGVLLDLGVSSYQLDAPVGFSHRTDSPLDMRFSPDQSVTAAELVNTLSEEELAHLLRAYGEEPQARRIARAIVRHRATARIATTTELREIVARVSGGGMVQKRLARVFQALRIAVNDELEHLRTVLDDAADALASGGRLVVIAYHSLEDRLVKEFFRTEAHPCICPPEAPVCTCGRVPRLRVLTHKVVVPAADEVRRNPRARSARLRAAERI